MGGYTKIVEKMLNGVEVKTSTDYFTFIKEIRIDRKTVLQE